MKLQHKRYILENTKNLSVDQIANDLNFRPRTVKKFLDEENLKQEQVSSEKAAQLPLLSPKWMIAIVFSLVVLGMCNYANSIKNPFIWDDFNFIENNPNIRNWQNVPRILKENVASGAIQKKSSSYRPLQMLTYLAEYSIWRLNPKGFHLTNILLHILAALSIFWMIRVLVKDNFLAYVTSLLFIIHPIHTEAVTYISGRADPLSAIFLFSCIGLYVRHLDEQKWYWYGLMLVTFVLALLSRESALIIPVLVLTYHYAFKKRIHWKPVGSLAVMGVIYVILRSTETLGLLSINETNTATLMQRLPGTFIAMAEYIRLFVFPFDLHMEYGRPLFQWSNPKVWIGFVVTGLILWGMVRERSRRPIVCFGITWYLINLMPVSNIFPVNAYMAEHWLYVPSVGVFLCAAYWMRYLWTKKNAQYAVIISLCVMIAFFSALTVRQNRFWRDPITFYNRLLAFNPQSSRLYLDIGGAYFKEKKYKEAKTFFLQAVNMEPGDVFAYNNLGVVNEVMGNRQEAMQAYSKAIQLNRRYETAYYNLGNLYMGEGRNKQAIDMYKRAVEIKPQYIKAHKNLGIVYNRQGKYELASQHYQKAYELDPNNPSTLVNIGTIYKDLKK